MYGNNREDGKLNVVANLEGFLSVAQPNMDSLEV